MTAPRRYKMVATSHADRDDIDGTWIQASEHTTTVAALELERDAFKIDDEAALNRLCELRGERDALERERDEAQSKVNTMKVVLDTVAAERDALRGEMEKWQHEARSLQGENDRLRAKHIPAPADRQATDEEIVAYIKHNDHTVLAANVSPGGVVDTNVTTYRMAGHRTDYVVRDGKVVRK